MKIALINDTHFGARNDNGTVHKFFERFYSDVFFPYLDKNKITKIVHLGDIFDRRKYINFVSLDNCRRYFFDQLKERGIEMDLILGNHDVVYKNTLTLNSPTLLLCEYDNINVIQEPVVQTYGKTEVLLLPWICPDNEQRAMDLISSTKAQVCFGHLEIQGFEMYKGTILNHGLEKTLYDKFDLVATGHYHHKSTRGNINYLGSQYQITWNDFDDPRGFHVFDTDKRSIKFIENPLHMFAKVYYDDKDRKLEDILSLDFSKYESMYLKVIVVNKTNPYWFDIFIDKLEHVASSVQTVEDHLNLDTQDTEIGEAEDTLTIMSKNVQQLNIESESKEALTSVLRELYTEALNLEQ